MTTKREQVLAAVEAALTAGLAVSAPGCVVVRNPDRALEVAEAGLVVLRDGDPGEPEVVLSPASYLYQHRADIEIYVQAGERAARIAKLDALTASIGTILAADRTFGGLCDDSRPEAPSLDEQAPEGAATISAALCGLTLIYHTTDPLA